MTHHVTPIFPEWEARLELTVSKRGSRSELGRRVHRGPLRIQKPFHPEGDAPVHLVLLHPPGGVVAGDRLHTALEVDEGAWALATTPAAQKLYRSHGPECSVSATVRAGRGASLEWFPGETIVFDGARARQTTRIDLDEGARAIGWEMICFGRPASELPFSRGSFHQRLEIARAGVPLLVESVRIDGGSGTLAQPWGLSGRPVFGTFWATTSGPVDFQRSAIAAPNVEWAVTDLGRLLVVRAIAHHVEDLRTAFVDAWRAVRPVIFSRDAAPPRIWLT